MMTTKLRLNTVRPRHLPISLDLLPKFRNWPGVKRFQT
jgi:hypothetical protein